MCMGDPGSGSTVANEATGGSPAYTRKPLVWSQPDANAIVTATVTFDLAPGVYNFAGTATSLTGATLYSSGSIPTVSYSQQAQHTLTITYQGK